MARRSGVCPKSPAGTLRHPTVVSGGACEFTACNAIAYAVTNNAVTAQFHIKPAKIVHL